MYIGSELGYRELKQKYAETNEYAEEQKNYIESLVGKCATVGSVIKAILIIQEQIKEVKTEITNKESSFKVGTGIDSVFSKMEVGRLYIILNSVYLGGYLNPEKLQYALNITVSEKVRRFSGHYSREKKRTKDEEALIQYAINKNYNVVFFCEELMNNSTRISMKDFWEAYSKLTY